jgi:hypothetical protein
LVDSGKCITYRFSIRADHMGGLFAIHSNAPSRMAQQVRTSPCSEPGGLSAPH